MVAALMIFLNHYESANCSVNRFCNVFLEFHSAITIFFVLSGFLITVHYFEKARLNLKSLRDFYIKRLVRIYALLILVTIPILL